MKINKLVVAGVLAAGSASANPLELGGSLIDQGIQTFGYERTMFVAGASISAKLVYDAGKVVASNETVQKATKYAANEAIDVGHHVLYGAYLGLFGDKLPLIKKYDNALKPTGNRFFTEEIQREDVKGIVDAAEERINKKTDEALTLLRKYMVRTEKERADYVDAAVAQKVDAALKDAGITQSTINAILADPKYTDVLAQLANEKVSPEEVVQTEIYKQLEAELGVVVDKLHEANLEASLRDRKDAYGNTCHLSELLVEKFYELILKEDAQAAFEETIADLKTNREGGCLGMMQRFLETDVNSHIQDESVTKKRKAVREGMAKAFPNVLVIVDKGDAHKTVDFNNDFVEYETKKAAEAEAKKRLTIQDLAKGKKIEELIALFEQKSEEDEFQEAEGDANEGSSSSNENTSNE